MLLGNTVFIWTLLLINIIVAATVREKRGLFIYKYHIFTVLCGTGISGSLSYVAAYLRAYKSFKHGLFRPWSEDPLDVVRTAFGYVPNCGSRIPACSDSRPTSAS